MGLFFNFIKSDENKTTAALAPFNIPDHPLALFTRDGFDGVSTFVSRSEAMSVPAFARGRNIICSSLAAIPLELRGRDMSKLPTPRFLQQPDPSVPTSALMAYTTEDLLLFGVAYWQVTEMDETTNRPRSVKWISHTRVDQKLDVDGYEVLGYQLDNKTVPTRGVGSLIAFTGLDEGACNRGGRTIKTAAALERAVQKYAQEPLPSVVLKSSNPLSAERIKALLDTWKASRQQRATAFLNDNIEMKEVGFSSQELQMNEARQYLVSEISRLLGIPDWYLGAAAGGSMVYANVTDERKTLVDFSLRPIMTAIEQRLSMNDVTVSGNLVRFNLDDFLRGNPKDRADVYSKLVPLGVLSVEEARQMEDLVL